MLTDQNLLLAGERRFYMPEDIVQVRKQQHSAKYRQEAQVVPRPDGKQDDKRDNELK